MGEVAVFLNRCLPLSAVFVHHQMASLQRYRPRVLACRRVVPSVAMEGIDIAAINRGHSLPEALAEAAFKLGGFSPLLQKAVRGADLVHAHFGPTGWLAMPIARRAGLPLVVTLHGFDVLKHTTSLRSDGPLQTVYTQQRHRLARQAARFVCVSEYVKKRAVAFGFPEEKCEVHYMGIPLPASEDAAEPRDAEAPFRLLAVGRLVPFKGHARLIEAVAAVEQAGHPVHLDIVGGGELLGALQKQAAESLRSCTFHGAKPHAEVLALMRKADLFCHASLHQENGQTEAFGLVVLEAQAAGLPVVAFASGGVPEALADGETGLLCPEGDVAAFRDAIIRLIADAPRRRAMAENAPRFVARHFDNAVQTPKLERIYDAVRRSSGAE